MNGNVMWMSDSFNTPSGFGSQTFHAVSRLTSGPQAIHVDNVAWQFIGNPLLLNDYWRILPSAGAFASHIFPHHVKIYKPDLLVTLSDLWNVNYVLNMQRKPYFKWMQWFPIDGRPIAGNSKWSAAFNPIDVIVAMSDFGEKSLLDGQKNWIEKNEREIDTIVEKVYHGIPVDLFKPYSEDERSLLRQNYEWQEDFFWDTGIRKEFVKGEKNLDDYFIFGIVARNQVRKNYPELLQAWALFAEMHDDVLLWIHAVPNDPARKVGDLHFITDQLGCADSVVFSDSISPWYGKSSKEMADIYNLFDCHFLPTAGEGFGLPTVEAMSCGVYTAVTDFTTGPELLDNGKCGYMIPHGRLEISTGAVMRAHLLADEIVEHLEAIYNTSAKTRRRIAVRARKRVIKKYSAKGMAENWRQLTEKHMPDSKNSKTKTFDLQFHFNDQYMAVRERDAQKEYSKNEFNMVGRRVDEGDKVLEIGCGSGEGMIHLTRHFGARVIGLDYSEKSVGLCRKKGLNVDTADFNETLDFDAGSFDVVFSQHVVEHLDDDVGPIVESLRLAKKCAIHIIPHNNMVDPSHQRRYMVEDVVDLIYRVKEKYNGLHMLWEDMSVKLNGSFEHNYVGDQRIDKLLISYALIFEKESE